MGIAAALSLQSNVNDTLTTILSYVVEYFGLLTVLMIALTIMIKIQSLQYKFLAVLICAAIAAGLEMIPVAGHYLAVAFLYMAIAKVTGADMYPDAAFTVAVSYALMFCMNLFVLGMLMGNLGLGRYDSKDSDFAEEAADFEEAVVTTPSVKEAKAAPPTPPPASKPSPAPSPAPAPVKVAAADKPGAATRARDRTERLAREIASKFSVKGITRGANKSLAMVHTGVKNYSIVLGQTLGMKTANGEVMVRFEEIGDNFIVLDIAGEAVELYLQ